MASIPFASTSKAIFAPSAATRLLARQNFVASRAAGPSKHYSLTASSRAHSKCKLQQVRHASTSSTSAAQSHRHQEEEAAYPDPRILNQSQIGRRLTARQKTRSFVTDDSDKDRSTPVVKAKGKLGGDMGWIEKQIELLDRAKNRKQDVPVRADQTLPFAFFAPPKQSGFTPFSEEWLTFLYAKFQNSAQSFRVSRDIFGFWKQRSNKRKIVTDQLLPLYQKICRARIDYDVRPIEQFISTRIREDLLKALRKQMDLNRYPTSWRFHNLEGAKVVSVRMVEMNDVDTMQMTVRFESQQSIEWENGDGVPLPELGSHDKPQKVVENFIFQKQPCREDSQPWTAIGPTPTLTPLQVIGKTDKRLLEAYRRKKKPSLTIAA